MKLLIIILIEILKIFIFLIKYVGMKNLWVPIYLHGYRSSTTREMRPDIDTGLPS
jgi:hypothetical protein